jgi:hypothetical protein
VQREGRGLASGCIIGECPICEELLWEDEHTLLHGELVHEECQTKGKRLNERLARAKKKAELFERHYITMRNALIEIRNISIVDDPSPELIRCFMTASTALEGHVEFANERRERDAIRT